MKCLNNISINKMDYNIRQDLLPKDASKHSIYRLYDLGAQVDKHSKLICVLRHTSEDPDNYLDEWMTYSKNHYPEDGKLIDSTEIHTCCCTQQLEHVYYAYNVKNKYTRSIGVVCHDWLWKKPTIQYKQLKFLINIENEERTKDPCYGCGQLRVKKGKNVCNKCEELNNTLLPISKLLLKNCQKCNKYIKIEDEDICSDCKNKEQKIEEQLSESDEDDSSEEENDTEEHGLKMMSDIVNFPDIQYQKIFFPESEYDTLIRQKAELENKILKIEENKILKIISQSISTTSSYPTTQTSQTMYNKLCKRCFAPFSIPYANVDRCLSCREKAKTKKCLECGVPTEYDYCYKHKR